MLCALQSQHAAIFSQPKIAAIFNQQTFAASQRKTAEIVFRVFDVDGKYFVVKVGCDLALQGVTYKLPTTPSSLSLLAEIAEAFRESDLPWKVDLIDWATTSELVLAPMTKQRHPSISTQASVIQLVRKISAIYHVKLPFNRYRGIAKKKTADLTYER